MTHQLYESREFYYSLSDSVLFKQPTPLEHKKALWLYKCDYVKKEGLRGAALLFKTTGDTGLENVRYLLVQDIQR